MYDAYILTADPRSSFDVQSFEQRAVSLPYVTSRPRSSHEFIVTEHADVAQGIDAMLAVTPDAQLPPVAVIEASPSRIVVDQNVDKTTLQHVRPLIELLVKGAQFTAADLEGRPISLPANDPLKPLFD